MTTAVYELDVQMSQTAANGDDDKPLYELLCEARELEVEVEQRMEAAKSCRDKCDHRIEQVRMAVESNLFIDFDVDVAAAIRRIGATVRAHHDLLARQLERARKLASQCDDALCLHDAAERLGERDHQKSYEDELTGHLEELRTIHRWNRALADTLCNHNLDQLSLFERLRR